MHAEQNLLSAIFPNADPQVVSALSSHAKALTRYLAQIHELTLTETAEAIEAFFGFQATTQQEADVA